MIVDLKPYPAMRDSGVPWLGEVPEHWDVTKLKYLVSFAGGGTPSKSNAAYWDGDVPWVSPKDMRGPSISDTADHITDEAVASTAINIIPAGAVLMVVRSGILRRTLPVAINTVRLALNQDMKALRPREAVLSPYLRAMIQGNETALIAEWTKQGATVESVEHQFLTNSRVPVPSLAEQTAIIRFLDLLDRRTRRYVRAKQSLIALLGEQKQATIDRAITRGIDPAIRLRPSGVTELGNVPEHWAVHKLYRLTDLTRPIMYGIVLPGPNVDDGVLIVKGGNCEPGRLRVELLARTTREIEAAYVRSRLRHRDIVYAIRGGIGAAEIVPIELEGANLTQDAARIAPGAGIEPSWLLHAVRSTAFRAQADAHVVGATIRGLNIRDLKRLLLAVPPTDEQVAISQWLDVALSPMASAVERAVRGIKLVTEYRTRLIADAVTGKIDVREAAALLPEQIDELRDHAEVVGDGDAHLTDDDDDAAAGLANE